MLKISEMLFKLEGFGTTPFDLTVGYYHIQTRKNASNLCTIIFPWGKYCYKPLPMGVENSPEISNRK